MASLFKKNKYILEVREQLSNYLLKKNEEKLQ